MKEYSPKILNILKTACLVVLIFFIIDYFILGSNVFSAMKLILFILLSYFIFYLFIRKRVTNIKIFENKKKIEICFVRYLFSKSKEVYLLEDISFSFKLETGARGIKSRELRFYKANTNDVILKIIPYSTCWSLKVVESINQNLTDLNVRCVNTSEGASMS